MVAKFNNPGDICRINISIYKKIDYSDASLFRDLSHLVSVMAAKIKLNSKGLRLFGLARSQRFKRHWDFDHIEMLAS